MPRPQSRRVFSEGLFTYCILSDVTGVQQLSDLWCKQQIPPNNISIQLIGFKPRRKTKATQNTSENFSCSVNGSICIFLLFCNRDAKDIPI
ncbi:hypothetical protein GDO81_005138 [Engystomops pustulosus]|uniref:Uncharacterized protein n=1 Tax=Engystomops pustulosus TaxID=76066 RepID=A0AAV7CL11_ENGPU|nr:hypothetical protein GDO81_005138 [Engystomops pustulosus]